MKFECEIRNLKCEMCLCPITKFQAKNDTADGLEAHCQVSVRSSSQSVQKNLHVLVWHTKQDKYVRLKVKLDLFVPNMVCEDQF